MCKPAVRALVIAGVLLGYAAALKASARSMTVESLEEGREPMIDGLVVEDVWLEVEPYTGFTQQNPIEGAPATEKTDVRVLLGRTTLYIGIIAFDSEPDKILVTESRRDGDLNETDSLQIVLDTFNDNQNAFLFGTNPAGLEYDGQVAAEGQTGGFSMGAGGGGSQRGGVSGFNANWDGDWSVRSAITDRGWETEMAIPLKTLRYDPGENRVWGFNVTRNIRRKNEQVYLSPIPRGYNVHRVSLAAKLEGLDLPGRRDVKVTPYGAGRTDEDNLALTDQRKNQFDLGVDVKWGVTPNLTADFTVNTDFAQVESDEQQVNLTRFPLFFPEKRPFFLENAQTFQFGAPQEVDLFFSRRIGLSSSGLPIPILAGARMSGKVGGYNIGILDMQTDEDFNDRTGALLAPAENFAVVRVQREVGRSNFGGIFVNRQATSSPEGRYLEYNRAYGVDANLQVTENAKLYSFVAGSTTPGEGSDYTYRSLLNYATTWWNGHVGYTEVGEHFNAATGFVPRRGFRKPQVRYFLDYQPKKYPWIRRFSPHVTWNAYWGFDGLVQTSRGHYHFFEIQPQSGGRFGARLDRDQDRPTEDFVIYNGADGTRVVVPPGFYTWNQWSFEYYGNPSATLYPGAVYTFGDFYDGKLKRFDLTANLKLGAKLQGSVGWRRDDVDLPGGDFVSDLVPVKVNYSFTPLTSLSALIQYNSQTADISSNIRFALLSRSGTGLFIVYNDQRNTADFSRIDEDTGAIYPTVIGRSFIVKYTYLFDF
ncbi:MAG TPA: DUF5916 domain-containing protein [Vicinamibacteria bacterium]|nr:DUF5916 domain-containing protein [Vicinamibacteria bacterium]